MKFYEIMSYSVIFYHILLYSSIFYHILSYSIIFYLILSIYLSVYISIYLPSYLCMYLSIYLFPSGHWLVKCTTFLKMMTIDICFASFLVGLHCKRPKRALHGCSQMSSWISCRFCLPCIRPGE